MGAGQQMVCAVCGLDHRTRATQNRGDPRRRHADAGGQVRGVGLRPAAGEGLDVRRDAHGDAPAMQDGSCLHVRWQLQRVRTVGLPLALHEEADADLSDDLEGTAAVMLAPQPVPGAQGPQCRPALHPGRPTLLHQRAHDAQLLGRRQSSPGIVTDGAHGTNLIADDLISIPRSLRALRMIFVASACVGSLPASPASRPSVTDTSTVGKPASPYVTLAW